MRYLYTETRIVNCLIIEDDSLTEKQIREILRIDPEFFGIDHRPYIESDQFLSLTDSELPDLPPNDLSGFPAL